jgi:hypothetical protein
MRRLPVLVLCSLLAALAFTATASAAPPDPHHPPGLIYDSSVRPLPGNLPSVGAEAYSFSELGDQVTFAGTDRLLKSVTVTLSSWGCQNGPWYSADCVTAHHATFSQPITFNIYSPATSGSDVPVAGTLLASVRQTFNVPYRPSSDPNHCTSGEWFDGKKQSCFNGLATNITFDFSAQHLTLPNTVVFGVAYNTSHYGPHPVGEAAACYTSSGGCPYDSLNIALGPQVNVGSKPFPNTLFQNAVYPGDYCDGGADGTGTMRLDSRTNACWTGYVPAVAFEARKTPPPGRGLKLDEDAISAEQCRSAGSHTIVDVHYTLINDYDSGFAGNAWANDTIKRHLQIWQGSNGSFCARVDDDGKFVTFAGPSPSGQSTVSAGVKGEIEGGYVTTFFTGTLNPNPAYRTHGDLGTFDLMCTDAYTCPGAHPSYLSYFSTTTGDDLAHWGWIYHAGNHGTWLNQDDVSSADGGDITG